MTKVSKAAIKAAMGANAWDSAVRIVFDNQDGGYAALLDHARLIETYEPHRLLDPDVQEAREFMAAEQRKMGWPNVATQTEQGLKDDTVAFKATLAALKSRPKA
jgi:hypothetical protein